MERWEHQWAPTAIHLNDLLYKKLSKNPEANFLRDEFTNERALLQVFSDKQTVEALQIWLDESEAKARRTACWKDNEFALDLREKGNRCYIDGDNYYALQLYNESIRKCPQPSVSLSGLDPSPGIANDRSPELSLAYANRSAVFFNWKRYQECLTDIAQALKLGYPEDLKHKLLKRRAECLFELGQFSDAKTALNEAKKFVCAPATKVRNKGKIVADIDKLWEKLLGTDPDEKISARIDVSEMTDLNFAHGCNDSIQDASGGIKLDHSAARGRYLEANKHFKVNDVMIVEEPYVKNIMSSSITTNCAFCLTQADQIVPCQSCADVSYCSIECQQEAWKQYHSFECLQHYVIAAKELGNTILALRILLKTNMEELCGTHLSKLAPVGSGKAQEPYGIREEGYKNDYSAIYNLAICEKSDRDMIQVGLTASAMLLILRKSKFFEKPGVKKIEEKISETYNASHKPFLNEFFNSKSTQPNITMTEMFFGSLLSKHIKQLECNQVLISGYHQRQQGDQYVSDKVMLACAVYPISSLLNHSCDPNCIVTFLNSKAILRARKDVKPGQELTIAYAQVMFSNDNWKNRQNGLKDLLGFVCTCEKCKIGPAADHNCLAYKCQNCGGPILDLESGQCRSCQKAFDKSWFEHCTKLAKESAGNLCDGTELMKSIKLHQDIYYKHNTKLYEMYKKASLWFLSQGYNAAAKFHFSKALEISEAIYGKDSLPLAFDLSRYADILIEFLQENFEDKLMNGETPDFETAKKCQEVSKRAEMILSKATRNSEVIRLLKKEKMRERRVDAFLKGKVIEEYCYESHLLI